MRSRAVEKVLHLRMMTNKNDFIRVFQVPIIDFNAPYFYEIINLNYDCVTEPHVIKDLSGADIEQIKLCPLQLRHPCHNQAV